MSSLCRSLSSFGPDSLVIDIECHLSNNLPTIIISGFAGRTVHESKDRLRGAFTSAGLRLPRKRITVNLAPADVPKTDSGLDTAIAISILAADKQIRPLLPTQAAIGELSLGGDVRAVRGIIGKLLTGRASGITEFYVPAANFDQAKLIPHIQVYPVATLRQLYEHLKGVRQIAVLKTGNGQFLPLTSPTAGARSFDDIAGQAVAKRALIIAAAGGHNLLLTGPPGTGKTMLAQALPALLPLLNHEEALETTHLQSLVSNNYEHICMQRPFRNPHHRASVSVLLGSGSALRPGEVSLSHRGVLCLDEFPEFSREAIEALRQPLEDRVVRVARSKLTAEFPADFMLVATANPCPCGFYGSSVQDCSCLPGQRMRYQSKLSGPILDRIDLCSDVHDIDYKRLLGKPTDEHAQAAKSVAVARQRQARRYQSSKMLNSHLTNPQITRYVRLEPAARSTLELAAAKVRLSARGYVRVVKVARTIADLADSPTITSGHIAEALQYRLRMSPTEANV